VGARREYFERVNRLGRPTERQAIDAAWLSALENSDSLFPNDIFNRFEPT